jgi:hypothetical protein
MAEKAELKELAQPLFRAVEILLGVERTQHVIGADTPVKGRHQGSQALRPDLAGNDFLHGFHPRVMAPAPAPRKPRG